MKNKKMNKDEPDGVLEEAQYYSDNLFNCNNALITSLGSLLYAKGVITEQEVNQMLDVAQKRWNQLQSEENKDE